MSRRTAWFFWIVFYVFLKFTDRHCLQIFKQFINGNISTVLKAHLKMTNSTVYIGAHYSRKTTYKIVCIWSILLKPCLNPAWQLVANSCLLNILLVIVLVNGFLICDIGGLSNSELTSELFCIFRGFDYFVVLINQCNRSTINRLNWIELQYLLISVISNFF